MDRKPDRVAMRRLFQSLGTSRCARGLVFGGTNYHRVRDAMRQDIVSGLFAQGEWLKIALFVERYRLVPRRSGKP